MDGFIAHEVAPYVPEAVQGEKDAEEDYGDLTDAEGNVLEADVEEPETLETGHTWTKKGTRPVYQSIDQSKLVTLLTAALQEALVRIDELEDRLSALEDDTPEPA